MAQENPSPAPTAEARQHPSPQRSQPGLQVKAQAPPPHVGEAFGGAAQAWQAGPQWSGSSSAWQDPPQAWFPASQVMAQVPAPSAGPGWQMPRPGPVTGPAQGVQPVPQERSLSTWQLAGEGAAPAQSRAGALQVNPQVSCTQAGLPFWGAVQGTQPPPHLRRSGWQT
jgi:hypothetical protein